MLSIDEVIARERQQAKIHRNNIVPKEDYHNMPWISKNNEVNMRNAEEHDQLVEWLEELKALRHEANELRKAGYAHGHTDGYDKAIDDAKSVILQTLDNEMLVDTLHLRLEQLKEQK